jgi:hypothetical protein
MARLPVQWISWDHANAGEPDDGTSTGSARGQFLYALKETVSGDRQAVLEGGSDRGMIAVVDFAGHNRKAGSVYYAWGAVTYLSERVDKRVIDADPVLSRAFSNRHGRSKRLGHEAATRLDELAAGLPEQRLPVDAPTETAELLLWTGGHGRSPEFLLHDEVEATKELWRQIGFKSAPRRGHRLQNGTYPDLYSAEGTVGEVKNVVGPNWGPKQIEGYIRQLDREEPEKAPWQGVLIHEGETLSAASRRALKQCGVGISVWSVWEGEAEQQFP